MKRVWFKIRWWYWFLSGPNLGTMFVRGYDKHTRDLLFERHDAKEPKE